MKRVFRVMQSILDKTNGIYPLSSIQRGLNNIDEIFKRTIHWKPLVEQIYYKNYELKKDHEMAKKETFKELLKIDLEIESSSDYLTVLELHGINIKN